MRVLCLDIGEKRIGIAVSDPLGITAQPVETLQRSANARDIDTIRKLAEKYGTDRILCGLPRNMDGSEGFQARFSRAFARKLEASGLNIRFEDERLTTHIARDVLIQANVQRKERKKYIDQLAAVSILQGFLDRGGWRDTKRFHFGGRYTMDEKFEQDQEQLDENIIELVDEDGQTVVFEHLLSLEYKGRVYICLAPAEPMEDVSEDELVIMRIETDEDGNDFYVSIDDEEELSAVFEEYLSIVEADEDEADPEEE